MRTTDDRIAAIRERYRQLADNQFTPAYTITDITWLLDRYEDARERLERLYLAEDDPCNWCGAASADFSIGVHTEDCPWRSAREHLEAE